MNLTLRVLSAISPSKKKPGTLGRVKPILRWHAQGGKARDLRPMATIHITPRVRICARNTPSNWVNGFKLLTQSLAAAVKISGIHCSSPGFPT